MLLKANIAFFMTFLPHENDEAGTRVSLIPALKMDICKLLLSVGSVKDNLAEGRVGVHNISQLGKLASLVH